MWAFDGWSNPVADALGAQPREVEQTSDLGWCAWIEISYLASNRSPYFESGPDGTVSEAESR